MASWLPKTKLERLFLAATGGQAVVNSAIQIVVLVVYLDWVNHVVYEVPTSYIVPLTLAVSTFGCLFQVAMTLDAYRIKNNVQIFLQCLFNACLSIATVFQYIFIKDASARIAIGYNGANLPFAKRERPFWRHASPALIVCAIVSCLCSAVMCALAFALHKEYAWAIYQHISPDRKTSKRYFAYQVYLVILKFTPFFLIAFVITYGLIDVHYQEPEFSLTMAIIPLSLLNVALAVFAVRKENRLLMAVVIILHISEIVYLVNRLIVLHGTSQRANTSMKDEIVLYAVAALFFSTAATVVGCACYLNFKKGLKPVLLSQVGNGPQTPEWSDTAYHLYPVDPNDPMAPQRVSNRFLID